MWDYKNSVLDLCVWIIIIIIIILDYFKEEIFRADMVLVLCYGSVELFSFRLGNQEIAKSLILDSIPYYHGG